MKRALTKNWGLKLLAFVFSVLLWIIVMNIEDPVDERTFSGIQVTVTHPEIVTNPGNTYQILDDSRTVSVTVKAKRSILNKIKTDDIRATADMKNLDVRTRSLIPIDISIPSYAGRFEATANPINLRVSIELGKSETFPITATSSGTPRDGYQVGELKANPEKIKISGPESVIDSIDKVVALVDVSGQSKDEEKEAIRENLGLNKSMPEQYWGWAKEVLKGDFGISLANHTSVSEQIIKRLPATLQLMGAALVLSVLLAIPLGLWSGYRKNTWIDNIISGLSYIGMSIPSFWLGMVLIIVFAAKLHILPSSGMHSVGNESFLDTVKHMIMPCITLSLSNLAVFIRYIRSNTIGQLGEEYVLAAKAKGTTGGKLLKRHILKNTLLPIITLLGMNLASIVCGSFIIESVFGWPGIGTLAMTAIGVRDYPVIMAYVMLSGIILVVGNFIADILYAFADPRIKREDMAND